MTTEGNDASFCRDHAFAGNPLFRISVILAPDHRRELTALYALFDLLLRPAPSTHDEGVVRSRLDWWRHECLVRDPRDSAHPALRELLCGERAVAFDRSAFADLVDQVERRLEAPAVGAIEELHALCADLGRPFLVLERGLADAEGPNPDTDRGQAIRRGAWALLADAFLRGDPAGPWWLPLDLLARVGMPRNEISAPERSDETARIFGTVFDSLPGEMRTTADISNDNQLLVHIHLMDYLIMAKCHRLRRSAPGGYGREMSRVRVGEFLGTWSRARRLNRPK